MDATGVRRLSAGQVDAAFSAIATFAIGLYAVWEFSPTVLGAYVVVFTAWNLARTLSSEIVFVPSEVVAIGRDEEDRIHILDSSLRRGLLLSVVGGAAVLMSYFIIVGDTLVEVAVALTVTGAAVTVLAPIHHHWRRMFHISEVSWRAATVSTVHLAVTVSGLVALNGLVSSAWIPFGALAMGFLVSLLVAAVLTIRVRGQGSRGDRPTWLELTSIGRWLLVATASIAGSEFLLVVLVRSLIGGDILGYAEGARVVARPVAILGIGLAAVLGPRSMRAAVDGDARSARRVRRISWVVGPTAAAIYLAAVGFDWALNPLPQLIPTAYVVSGLVAGAIIGEVIQNIAIPWFHEALGARKQKTVALSEITGSAAKLLTGFLAPVLGALVLPVGWIVGWSIRAVGLGLGSRKYFGALDSEVPSEKPIHR